MKTYKMKSRIYTLITAVSLVSIWIIVIYQDIQMNSEPEKKLFAGEKIYHKKIKNWNSSDQSPSKRLWLEQIYHKP